MAWLELPQTHGCLVCGRDNPTGFALKLFADSETGIVQTHFTVDARHAGFDGIVHGGALATLLDEAMVWSATWACGRFCLCGEMTVRFRQPSRVGETLTIQGITDRARGRLVLCSGKVLGADGSLRVEASGKFVPLELADHRRVLESAIRSESTDPARKILLAKAEAIADVGN